MLDMMKHALDKFQEGPGKNMAIGAKLIKRVKTLRLLKNDGNHEK